MKKFTLLLILFIGVAFTASAYQMTIKGHVTDTATNLPLANQMVIISTDSVPAVPPVFSYFKILFTDNSGFYSDNIMVMGSSNQVYFVSVVDCNGLKHSSVVQPSAGNHIVNFSICGGGTNPPPPICNAGFTAQPWGWGGTNDKWKFFSQSTPWSAVHAWDFGDGNTSNYHNPMHTYATPGTYNVCLIISDSMANCADTFCMSILVDTNNVPPPPQCNADFTAFAMGWGAFNDKWKFNSQSTPWQAMHTWDFGDGNTSNYHNPIHTYAATGQYNVCLVISDSMANCADTFCMIVIVDSLNIPPPQPCEAEFTAHQMGWNSTPFTWKFHSISLPFFSDHYWDFGDGTTDTVYHPVHTYAAAGTYNVCLVISNPSQNCVDTFCMNILVDSVNIPPMPCVADFTANPASCPNGLPFTWKFHSLSLPFFSDHYWDFGDGTTDTVYHPMHTFPGPGQYNVCLIISNSNYNCSDTFCMNILVDSTNIPPVPCQADFIAHQQGWSSPTTWKFQSLSLPFFSDHYWDFGDGSTDTVYHPVHTYAAPGQYNVCLVITNNNFSCADTFCMLINVDTSGNTPNNCTADFIYFQDSVSGAFHFIDLSFPWPHTRAWDFGDGNTSTIHNPWHTYTTPGNYVVSLTITTSNPMMTCTATHMDTLILTSVMIAAGIDELNANEAISFGTVYPNPANQNAFLPVTVTRSSNVTMSMINISGQVISQEQLYLEAGKQEIELDLQDTGAGIYNLMIMTDEGLMKTFKIIKN